MNDKNLIMTNDSMTKALEGLGLKWSEDGNGKCVIKSPSYDIFLLVSDDRPKLYEISAMAYLPDEFEDKQSFIKDVLDTVNNCGYPELRAELINRDCILSKDVKYRPIGSFFTHW